MQEIVTADHFGLRIGKKGERVSLFPAEVLGDLRSVNADGYEPNAQSLELLQILLDAS